MSSPCSFTYLDNGAGQSALGWFGTFAGKGNLSLHKLRRAKREDVGHVIATAFAQGGRFRVQLLRHDGSR
jgi:hypothetical protein